MQSAVPRSLIGSQLAKIDDTRKSQENLPKYEFSGPKIFEQKKKSPQKNNLLRSS